MTDEWLHEPLLLNDQLLVNTSADHVRCQVVVDSSPVVTGDLLLVIFVG